MILKLLNDFHRKMTLNKFLIRSKAENYSFLPDKDGDTCIISVISNKILANGGSGTVGLYQVLPDGSFYNRVY